MEAERWNLNKKLSKGGQMVGKGRNGGMVNDSCKRWRNGRRNVTVEELESLLN